MKITIKTVALKQELIQKIENEYKQETDPEKDYFPEYDFLDQIKNSPTEQLEFETDTDTVEMVTDYYPTYFKN